MQVETLVGGFGGQGILFFGRILAIAGMFQKYEVSWYPSYGPEMRGGTANCTIIVADQEIGSPVSDHPDLCVAMNEPSLRRYGVLVRQKGTIIINASLIHTEWKRENIRTVPVPGNSLAMERVGNPRVLNMVLLGAANECMNIVSFEHLYAAVREELASKSQDLVTLNLKAIDVGREYISRGDVACW